MYPLESPDFADNIYPSLPDFAEKTRPAATAKKYSDEQVHLWRRSHDVPSPALTKDDKRHPVHDPRYKHVPESDLPCTECLKETVTLDHVVRTAGQAP
jgi:bisphosphoglycerate-dependent phosphoglycerate mutase